MGVELLIWLLSLIYPLELKNFEFSIICSFMRHLIIKRFTPILTFPLEGEGTEPDILNASA
jgi:hypothetical protein